MSERWGHECIEGAIIRMLAGTIRFVAGDQGDREHEAESLRQHIQWAKTEHDELRASLAAARDRAEQAEQNDRDSRKMLARQCDLAREAECIAAEAQRRLERLREVVALCIRCGQVAALSKLASEDRAWAQDSGETAKTSDACPPVCGVGAVVAPHSDALGAESRETGETPAPGGVASDSQPVSALRCWDCALLSVVSVRCLDRGEPVGAGWEACGRFAPHKAEPAAPALDPKDVLALVRAAIAWSEPLGDFDDGDGDDERMAINSALEAAVDALPPAWREAARKP